MRRNAGSTMTSCSSLLVVIFFLTIWSSDFTTIRTPFQSCKTSFTMGLDYVLKGPSDYLQKVKRRCGVTQKKPFSWFEIVGFFLRIFSTFLSLQNKSIKSSRVSLLSLLEGCMLSKLYYKKRITRSWCNLFLRIDLPDCAADQFS